jgi:hypothetical protein
MKPYLTILGLFCLSACAHKYQKTSFYVKNTSSKVIHFKATMVELSSAGTYEVTLPFMVMPNDSVLVRQIKVRKGAVVAPADWFAKFVFSPTEGVIFNDPDDPHNWLWSLDESGKPAYTFRVTY